MRSDGHALQWLIDPKITLLWGSSKPGNAWPKEAFTNQNNHSVVLRIDYGKASMLISGDLEEDGIAALVDYYKGSRLLDVDLYQVGHHGSANATTEPFLRAMTPDIAVIATGRPVAVKGLYNAWVFGHPRRVVVDTLVKHVRRPRPVVAVQVAVGQRQFETMPLSKAIYATGWDGDLVFEAAAAGGWKRLTEPDEKELMDDEVTGGLVNINLATVEELVTLPMIGPARAAAIVGNRLEMGSFRSVEDLQRIRGIGKGTIDALRNLVKTGD